MRTPGLLLLAGLGSCTSSPAPMNPVAGPMRSASLASELLNAHNRERSAAGVSPLTWDPVLASAANGFAERLAVQGQLRHSARQARPGQGENLWMGTRAAFPLWQMAASWASEKRWFRPGLFPAVSRTGNWADVGHYSQMIWPTTTQLGCGLASNPRSDVLVCRYAPAGNIDGRRVP